MRGLKLEFWGCYCLWNFQEPICQKNWPPKAKKRLFLAFGGQFFWQIGSWKFHCYLVTTSLQLTINGKKIKCIHTPTSCTGKLLWVKCLMFLCLSHHSSSSSHNLCNLYPKYKSKGILGCSNYWWYKYQALLLYCGVTKKNMLLKLIVKLNIQQACQPWNIIANYIHFTCSLHIFHLDKYQFWTYTYTSTSTLRIKTLMMLLLHQSIRNLYKFLVKYLKYNDAISLYSTQLFLYQSPQKSLGSFPHGCHELGLRLHLI